jgi:hypothetical protein
MSDSLATLTDKLQALLVDDGTVFSDDACEAGIRQALKDLNFYMPVQAATTLDTVDAQNLYELTEADAGAHVLNLYDVLLEDPAGGDLHKSLDFHSHQEDERWYFYLHLPQPAGRTLIVRFTQPHTIEDLDGASDGTLQPEQETVLLDHAAEIACRQAIAANASSYWLDANVGKTYALAADKFQNAWQLGLAALRSMRRPATSQRDTRTWEDPYHNGPALT